MKARPYQRTGIDAIRSVLDLGLPALLVLATGLGKALRNDQRVLTPSGWVQICDLKVGDFVIGGDGLPTRVDGVYPQGARPMFTVRTTDGAEVVCDESHLWNVRTKYDKHRGVPFRTITLRDAVRSGINCQQGKRWELPSVAPVDHPLPPSGLPLDPYLLGVLLGDGGMSIAGRILITAEHDLVATLHQYLPPPCTLKFMAPAGKAGTYYLGGPVGRGANPVLDAIRSIGLSGHTAHTKFIPECYIIAPAADRLGVLQGLMDTDGHVTKDGHVEITLASRLLAEGVQAIVRSLGGRAVVRQKATTWKHKGERRHGIAWRVSVAMSECPFRWKAPRWTPRSKYDSARRIASVTPAGEAEATCIKVAAPDGLFVTEGYIVTHNTVVFSILGRELRAEGIGKVLVLAHRNELLQQARDKWLAVEPDANVGIYQGARKEAWADVICASIQSCYPDKLDDDGNVLKRGRVHDLPLAQIGLIIIDECHHAPGGKKGERGSYLRLIDAAREANPSVMILGVTATPYRADRVGLGVLWDRVAYRMSMSKGIEEGHLAPLIGARVSLDLDMTTVRTSKTTGDFIEEDLGRVIDTESARREIVRRWSEEARHRRTVAFTPTVESAKHLCADFVAAGVTSEWISGEMPKADRKRILDAYQAGAVDVLVNCQVLTEGWDAPATSCVLIARPTKSVGMYAQMVGRGTRMLGQSMEESRANGKPNCLIMDCVGASKLGLASLADLSCGRESVAPGIDPEEEEDVIVLDPEAQDALFPMQPTTVVVKGSSVYEIDLFGGAVAWAKIRGTRVVCLDIGHSVVAYPGQKGWTAMVVEYGAPMALISNRPEREVMRAAEEYAMAHGKAKYMQPSDFLARKPASDRQILNLGYLVAANQKIDPAFTPTGMPEPKKMGMPQAWLWIAYLKARVAFATNRPAQIEIEKEMAP